eukprot:CAMPEP_0197244998 /NCGR_PEP_ID=MMETSP1429-20130617/9929_1 /TAXON_ID=49237 /ORGANISM="Chaetoceros  sp., Strain UNC1202" /LENGTH=745 /DNA_ID=CAMNT_0042705431 /DNA_START=63 /DNA_END=2300 /DNA_ORIENTATION=+
MMGMDMNMDIGMDRLLGGGGGDAGVHVAYDDIWYAMAYLCAIWTFGFLSEKILFMPPLVGQIFAGIICGHAVLDIVPYPEAFVLLGEIGLVLLVIEAGVDIDVMTLKLIGKRGVIIAILGSIFPIAIALGIAFAMGESTKASIAAGAAFGPTSLGIAMNILRAGKIINTPTGQLIVAAAIIDDMIALIILSQLGGLAGEMTISGLVVPIVSAFLFLIVGGYAALFIIPPFLDRFVFRESMSDKTHGKMALGLMVALVIGLMQATHVAKASHLMGAFIAGLVFCTDHNLHVEFVSQYKRLLQWLMRVFFASTIGFQVPIKDFGNTTVLWKGFVFTLALLGKIGVGFLVPNFSQSRKYTGYHLRDCLIVGCSMAAEGEFAFVIAAFALGEGIIEKELYSSIVLAILLSTILAPFSLRFTINYFNKRAMKEVEEAEILEATTGDIDSDLKNGILKGSTVFFCVNTTSHAAWGTLPKLMSTLFGLQLDVIDHRSWHSRFEDTVVNEVYVKADLPGGTDIQEHTQTIFDAVHQAIDQPDAVIAVSRWTPGVLEGLGENDDVEALSGKLVEEARNRLDKSSHKSDRSDNMLTSVGENNTSLGAPSRRAPRRRIRIVSTPSGAGKDMFGALTPAASQPFFKPELPVAPSFLKRRNRTMSTPLSGDMFGAGSSPVVLAAGEVLVNIVEQDGKKMPVKLKQETFNKIRLGGNPLTLIESKKVTTFEGQYLDGFVRGSLTAARARSNSNLSVDKN